ncbi:hydantoinase B/oxoprolinase family protein [Streptosporangium sp. KLBMP 9127]|nr:hydantoinase B/oxoprolinase family protein [Streptosporangium sp. KLBMP 9127]
MRLDPVTLEIVGNRLGALTEEMCLTLQRTSRSLYVKETADFCCALAGVDGGFAAYPRGIGVSGFVGLNCLTAVRAAGPLEPGDVIITNDPYRSGGLATHLTDIQLIEPYFHDGEIVGYGWAFIHCSDIGGRVPSSLSPTNDEIYQEGLQIPPVKLVRAGRPNHDVELLLSANSRTPEANLGDIRAMLAALRTGRERLAGVIAQHGVRTLLTAQDDLIDYTARKASAALSRLGEGTHRFVDYLDDDAVSRVPVRLSVTATLAAGRLHLDFTGTDPQVAAAFNIATLGTAHAWITTRVLALICTLDPDIALNAGLMRPISVTVPEGSLVNPVRPAAVGVRHAAASRVNDAVGGALGLAAPDVLPAASSGLVVPVVVAEHTHAGQNVQVLEPMVGGTGARLGSDGVDGRDSGISNLSNNPVETVETEIGVEILRYGLRRDSGGAGRWRGGCGLELTFRVLGDNSRLLARGLERLCFRPWGAVGGRPGAPTELIVDPGTPRERRHLKIDVLPLERGSVVTLLTSGAGGYGDPLLRDPAAVLRDVERGVVSIKAAASDYGVIIEESAGVLTLGAPARPVTPEGGGPGSEFGPERVAWESVFDVESVDRLVAGLFALPHADRSPRRTAVYAAALRHLPDDFPRTPAAPDRVRISRQALTDEILKLEHGE